MFNDLQIAEIRRVCRLEALRSAVFSVASESLDDQITAMYVTCELEGDTLGARVEFSTSSGAVVMGCTL